MTSDSYTPSKSKQEIALSDRIETLKQYVADLEAGNNPEAVDLEEYCEFGAEFVGKDAKLHEKASDLLALIRRAAELRNERSKVETLLSGSDQEEEN